MPKLFKTMLVGAALCASAGAYAGPVNTISDSGDNAYWGGDAHGYGDVIGGSLYDIQGASMTRAGSVLTIGIATNFAGHAGADPWAARGGIAYGDVFLAETWKPFGNDAHYLSDNDNNGTLWSYGFSLDNRFSNTGGSFKLYQLNGATNDANVKDAEAFLTCRLGVECYYRNGQATAVNRASATVKDTGLVGTWTVTRNQSLEFKIDLTSTDLRNYASYAMHWGETCQNDVIEGQVNMVPVPGVLPLMMLGLAALGAARRRTRRG